MPFAEYVHKIFRDASAALTACDSVCVPRNSFRIPDGRFARLSTPSWTAARVVKKQRLRMLSHEDRVSITHHKSIRLQFCASLGLEKSVEEGLMTVHPVGKTIDQNGPPDERNRALQNIDSSTPKNEEEDSDDDPHTQAKDDDDYDYDDELVDFRPILESLDLKKLGRVAMMVRVHYEQAKDSMHLRLGLQDLLMMTCRVDPMPMFHTQNLAFGIAFSDGVKWAARIPGQGTKERFQQLDVEKMETECQSMRYIRSNATFPIPELFYWTTSTSLVGTPFALMSFVEGRPLGPAWMLEYTDQQRLEVLSEVAKYMSDFHKFSFDTLGMLDFAEDGHVKGVRGEIQIHSCFFSPWETTVELPTRQTFMEAALAALDKLNAEEASIRRKGGCHLLRTFLQSMPDVLTQETRFRLSPPDFDFYKVFVNEQGHITGVIHWEGVHLEPSCTGFARFPPWICQDWEPQTYYYDAPAPLEEQRKYYSSPEALSRYRQHYATVIASHLVDTEDYDPRMTTLSHIVNALMMAINDSTFAGGIEDKLLDHAHSRNQDHGRGI